MSVEGRTPVGSLEPGITLAVVLPPEMAEAVRARAAAGDRSVSAELRRLLRGRLSDRDPEGIGVADEMRDHGARHEP